MGVLSRRVVEQCRVVVDNDYAGDSDGILALAHHLLSPSNRVVAITSSFLNPRFVVPPATPGATAEDGARLAAALLEELRLESPPPISIGAEEAGGGRSAAAEAIVAAAREESDLPLFVVCAGPLTNVAAALPYAEGIFVGHRGHAAGRAPEPHFWFGHGLGYGTWDYLGARVDDASVAVTVRNTSARASREVVQVYLSPADPGQPVRLVGWAAADVPAGNTAEVVVRCDERMWRRWDAETGGWARLDGGELLVARGLGDIRLRLSVD